MSRHGHASNTKLNTCQTKNIWFLSLHKIDLFAAQSTYTNELRSIKFGNGIIGFLFLFFFFIKRFSSKRNIQRKINCRSRKINISAFFIKFDLISFVYFLDEGKMRIKKIKESIRTSLSNLHDLLLLTKLIKKIFFNNQWNAFTT